MDVLIVPWLSKCEVRHTELTELILNTQPLTTSSVLLVQPRNNITFSRTILFSTCWGLFYTFFSPQIFKTSTHSHSQLTLLPLTSTEIKINQKKSFMGWGTGKISERGQKVHTSVIKQICRCNVQYGDYSL